MKMFLRGKTCGMSENSSLLKFRKYHSKKAKKDPTVEKSTYIFFKLLLLLLLSRFSHVRLCATP